MRALILLIVLVFALAAPAEGKRVALVIGINSYPNLSAERQLKKAVNDAASIRDTLKNDLGFDVVYKEDANWGQMKSLIKQVEAQIASGDVVFIYFSGHGVSIGSGNYLLPSDIPKPTQGEEERLIGNSFEAEALAQRMRKRGAQAVFSVLDACRDNPFVDEKGKAVGGADGLTTIDRALGVFTLFAAGLGQVALDRLSEDDSNPNSVFTRSLIPLLKTGGLTQVDLAKKVQEEVIRTAALVGHDQMPVYNDGLRGLVTLKEPGEVPREPPRSASAAEEWLAVEKSRSKSVLEAFQRKYKDDPIYGGLAAERLATLFPEKRKTDENDKAADVLPLPLPEVDSAADELVHQCDMLASHPDDLDKPEAAPGIVYDNMVSNDAVRICEQALGKRPNVRRLVYQVGRAYDKGNNVKAALSYHKRAAAMGSSAAMAALAALYNDERNVERNPEETIKWGKKALGNPSSFRRRGAVAYIIGNAYDDGGKSLEPNPKLARAWLAAGLDEGEKLGARTLAALIDDAEGGPLEVDVVASILLLGYCRGEENSRDLLLKEDLSNWASARALQDMLKQSGFYSGESDGVVGAGTRKALEQAEPTICPEIETKFKAEGGVFASLRKQGIVGEDPRKEVEGAKTGGAEINDFEFAEDSTAPESPARTKQIYDRLRKE